MIIMPDGIRIDMKWRRVEYIKENKKIVFDIEPMMDNSALVSFPSEKQWLEIVNDISLDERLEIIFLLERINWKRKIKIIVLDIPVNLVSNGQEMIILGSMEDTEAGRKIESDALFDPESKLSKEQVSEVYLKLEKRYCSSLVGRVNLPERIKIPGSVFDEFILPILKDNPKVVL